MAVAAAGVCARFKSISGLTFASTACFVLIISLKLTSHGQVASQETLASGNHQQNQHPLESLQNDKELLVTNSRTEYETRSDNQFGRVPHRSHRHRARPPLGPIVSTYEQIALAGSQVRLICPHAVGHHPAPEANSFATHTHTQHQLPNTKQQQTGWRSQSVATSTGAYDGRGETKAWTKQSSSGSGGSGNDDDEGLDSRIVSGANYNGHEQQIRWFRNHVPLLRQAERQESFELLNHGRQRAGRNEFKLGQRTTGAGQTRRHAHPVPSPSGQSLDESSDWLPHRTDPEILSELNQTQLSSAGDDARGSEAPLGVSASDDALAVELHQKLETEQLQPSERRGELGKSSGENVNEPTPYEQSKLDPDLEESRTAPSSDDVAQKPRDNWYVSKYGELVIPDVSPGTAGRYTCLYAGQQSELILDVIDDSGNEPEGVARSPRVAGPAIGQHAQQKVARARTRRAEEGQGRARTAPCWATTRPPQQAPRLPHLIESEIVSDEDLEVIPGLMYTKQQLYCPMASQADLHLALRQHVHWLTRSFCTGTAAHGPPHASGRPQVASTRDAILMTSKCVRLAGQLIVRLLNLLTSRDDQRCSDCVSDTTDGPVGENQHEESFFQIVWYKDNRPLEFHPDGRGMDKNINVKLINFIDQFKLSTTTTTMSGGNNNEQDNENKAPEGPLEPEEQIDMSEPGKGPSSLLREQGRRGRRRRTTVAAMESTGAHQHQHTTQRAESEGSLSWLDLCPLRLPPRPPVENLILEIDGIRRDKAGRYTCALQFNSSKLASLLAATLKRHGLASGDATLAAALADNGATHDGIACPHGVCDKSKCCDPTLAKVASPTAAAAAAERESGRQVRQITQFDRGAPPPEIGTIEEPRPTLRAAAAAGAAKTSEATSLESESSTGDNKQTLSNFDSSFRASQPEFGANPDLASQKTGSANTKQLELKHAREEQQSESAISVIGDITVAGGDKEEEAGDQQQAAAMLLLAQQISYLKSILNGSISSEDSLNYIEQRIPQPAHFLPAPHVVLQTIVLLVTERPANSCSLWATINEANGAYSRRKFVDFERLKRRETLLAPARDHSMRAKADGADLTTNDEFQGEQTKGASEVDADEHKAQTASWATGGSLIKDAASAEVVPTNRAFNYANEQDSRKARIGTMEANGNPSGPNNGPLQLESDARARAKHKLRASQHKAAHGSSRAKTRQNGQIERRAPLPLELSNGALTSPGDNHRPVSSNNDQVKSTTPFTDSGGVNHDDDDDEELLWTASQYLYMHMRAYASSSLYGVQVDVEWSNERQRHQLPYSKLMIEQDDDNSIAMVNADLSADLTSLASDDQQQQQQQWRWQKRRGQRTGGEGDHLAPFATIDLVAGQDLHLQCTAQALGRLPEVRWYKRISKVPEFVPHSVKVAMLRRSRDSSQENLYWPVTRLDLLGTGAGATKFVCSQSSTIFDNLLNQTFTVISSLKLGHYKGGGVADPLASAHESSDSNNNNNLLDVQFEGREDEFMNPSIFACMVDADIRHQEATLGVRFRQAPGKRLPIALRKRLRARSLMGRKRNSMGTSRQVDVALPTPKDLPYVDQASGQINTRESNYDFLRRDQLFVPLRGPVWLPASDRNITYLDASDALDSYNGAPPYGSGGGGPGLMSPIMLALVIAFLSSSLITLVYLTLKSYRALTNFRLDDDLESSMQCAPHNDQPAGQDTLCEFNSKDNSVKHSLVVDEDDDVTTSGQLSFNQNLLPHPNLRSFPAREQSKFGDHELFHMSDPMDNNNNSAGQRLYYDAHFHDLDPHYMLQELTSAVTTSNLGQETTTCSPLIADCTCSHTMAHATESNVLDLLSRSL